MRDKPQEALHFGFWCAKQQPPQQRGRRLAAAAVFRAIYATEWPELALSRLLVGRARAHRRPAAARPKVCQACPLTPLT